LPDDRSYDLLHPLRDDPATHMIEDGDGVLCPRTPRGAVHIERLHLNRPQLVAYRRQRRAVAESSETQLRLLEKLRKLEEQIETLTEQLGRLRGR
jgi:hypothetical protein